MVLQIPLSDFDDLVQMLRDIYDNHELKAIQCWGSTFWITNGDLDLYFRFLPHRLTIARIDVGKNRMRQGIGTRILEWFKTYCAEHQIREIVIESVLTVECENFAIKHGFVRRDCGLDCMDWILSLSPDIHQKLHGETP